MPITTPQQLDLAQSVSAWIQQNPGLHNQATYTAETEAGAEHCIAGIVVALTPGARFDYCGCCVATADGAVDIAEFAQTELGLTEQEAFDLFFEYRNAVARQYLDQLIADGSAHLATV